MTKISKKLGNSAVSEVMGTIFILMISISIFSVVSITLFSIDVKEEIPTVDIVASIEENFLILSHRGGESLDLETTVMVAPDGHTPYSLIINEGTLMTLHLPLYDGQTGSS